MGNEEIWASVPGFDGFYEASTFGRIRSVRRYTRCVSKAGREFKKLQGGQCLKQVPHNAGYLQVAFSADGERSSHLVHRIVAATFLPNPEAHPWINHKDGNKHNNVPDNLEWCTPLHNTHHAMELGLHRVLRGSEKTTAKLNEHKVGIIRELMVYGYSNEKLGEFFGVAAAVISNIRHGHAWKGVDRAA